MDYASCSTCSGTIAQIGEEIVCSRRGEQIVQVILRTTPQRTENVLEKM